MTYGTIVADQIQNTTGYSLGAGDASLLKNRIINGAMVIDQRNAGASVTANDGVFGVDRFKTFASQSSKLNVQQNAGSVTPPLGFSNYLGYTSTSAYSIGSSDYFQISHAIEGFNIADLNWGTANAKTVTLSFQVYSSLTGTFAGLLLSTTASYSYPFTYTISSANTWTSISITIAGPQVASWNTTNGTGVVIRWGLGIGSSLTGGTSNIWNSGAVWSSVGTSVVGTNGATFYITGVQLEVGSSATGFEYRQYGQELSLCQRYCQKSYNQGTVPGSNVSASGDFILMGGWGTANAAKVYYAYHQIPLRPGTQSLSFWDVVGNASKISTYDTGFTRTDNVSANGGNGVNENRNYTAPGTSTVNGWAWAYLVTSEL